MSEFSPEPFAGCRAYLEAHRLAAQKTSPVSRPVITISREAGAGAVTIGQRVAELLNANLEPGAPAWTVFDKNIVQRVLEDHALPKAIAEFLPEDVHSGVTGAVEEMLGLHPSAWKLAEHTTETILHLATLGNAILIGRGANLIASHIRPALHIRLVAPLEDRVRALSEFHNLTLAEAATYAKKADQGRKRYVKRYFNADISDPLNYTLTLNTGSIDHESIARIIAEALAVVAPAPALA